MQNLTRRTGPVSPVGALKPLQRELLIKPQPTIFFLLGPGWGLMVRFLETGTGRTGNLRRWSKPLVFMQKQKPETENSQKGKKSWGGPGPGSGQDLTSRKNGKLKNGKLKNQVK